MTEENEKQTTKPNQKTQNAEHRTQKPETENRNQKTETEHSTQTEHSAQNTENNTQKQNTEHRNRTQRSEHSAQNTEQHHPKSHREERSTKKSFPWTIVIIIALIVIALGVGINAYNHKLHANDAYKTYNGFEFKQSGQYWITDVERNGQLFEAPFYVHPKTLEERNYSYQPIVTKFMMSYPHQKYTIAISPDAGSVPVLAGVDIARIVGKFYQVPTKSALFIPKSQRNTSVNYTAPVVDCSDASVSNPIIWITSSLNSSGIYLYKEQPACIIISGSSETPEGRTASPVVEMADLFAYKILGIMK